MTSTLSSTTSPTTTESGTSAPVLVLKRRTIDSVLIALGVLATVVLLIAGVLLTWGYNFSNDYVKDELSSQNISFPDAAALEDEGRTDLLGFAGEQVTTAPGDLLGRAGRDGARGLGHAGDHGCSGGR